MITSKLGRLFMPGYRWGTLGNSIWGQFNQNFTSSFYAWRSQMCKNDSQVVNLFYAFGIYKSKSRRLMKLTPVVRQQLVDKEDTKTTTWTSENGIDNGCGNNLGVFRGCNCTLKKKFWGRIHQHFCLSCGAIFCLKYMVWGGFCSKVIICEEK